MQQAVRSKTEIWGYLFVALGVFPALLCALSLLSYLLDGSAYVFGTEFGGYIYTSAYHYVASNLLVVALLAIAIWIEAWRARIAVVMMQLIVFAVTSVNW